MQGQGQEQGPDPQGPRPKDLTYNELQGLTRTYR